jgi:Divergent InlB B-repeat domain
MPSDAGTVKLTSDDIQCPNEACEKLFSTPSQVLLNCPSQECEKLLPTKAQVILTAPPDASGAFPTWTGCDSPPDQTTSDTCTVQMTEARDVTAMYGFLLTVTVPPPGVGTVTSTPPGINCRSGTCTEVFPFDEEVLLTAAPDASGALPTWTGCDTPTDTTPSATCTVTMTEAKQVIAQFENTVAHVTMDVVTCKSPAACPVGFSNNPMLECVAVTASGTYTAAVGGEGSVDFSHVFIPTISTFVELHG